MRSASNYLALYRHSKKLLIQFLSLVLIVSSLSVISIPTANAGTIGTGPCASEINNSAVVVVSTPDGTNDCVIQFKESTTWTTPASVTSVRLLVIGGGGAGGAGIGGGGGAGEFVQATNYGVSSSTGYVVSIGGGGQKQAGPGGNGGESGFHTLYAFGGGGGGFNETAGKGPTASNGPNLGSGGGGGFWTRRTDVSSGVAYNRMADTASSRSGLPTDVAAFRNNGGEGSGGGSEYATGGGGGGAGAVGNPGLTSSQSGGDGGIGKISNITGTDTYYAAGGGGGINGQAGFSNGARGSGGNYGGGPGGNSSANGDQNGVNGIANTGSGGGGASNAAYGGNGGSGIVIVRYTLGAALNPTFGTPTPTADGFTVQITNYDASYTWGTPTVSAGVVTAGAPSGSTRLLTVTGLTAGQSATITQTTSRAGNLNGSATVSGNALSECSGTSSSVSGGYTIVKFTNTGKCFWKVPAGVTVAEALVVGGGGGAGSSTTGPAGGGGGGGVSTNSSISVTPNSSIVVEVGSGGVGGSGATGTGGNGVSSSFGSSTPLTALGGGGGGAWDQDGLGGSGVATGGGGGGIGRSCTGTGAGATFGAGGRVGGAGASNLNAGGYGVWGWGGAGGGAGGAAINGTCVANDGNQDGTPGPGVTSSISGTATEYGRGGYSYHIRTTLPLTANTGWGGVSTHDNSSYAGYPAGTAGSSGVVVVRYINAPVISLSASTITGNVGSAITNLTVTNTGGAATYSISSPSLPSGLSINSSTGTVSGTPGALSSATTYTITATNSSGSTTATFSFSATYSSCTLSESSSGGYKIISLTTVQTCGWSVPAGVTTADVLVVGGGGGGAGNMPSTNPNTGGSGGGGGVYQATAVPISGTIEITVGAGGAGGSTGGGEVRTGRSGAQGASSAFGTITAGGGGGGGCEAAQQQGESACPNGNTIQGRPGTAAGNGGSSSFFWNAFNFGNAGSASSAVMGGTTFAAVNGFAGGTYDGPNNKTGSGGGAGGAGNLNTPGAGVSSSITGTATVYGKGGASNGATGWSMSALSANTGTGGSGAYASGATALSGVSGSSGIVVIKYALPTLTPTFGTPTATANGFTVEITNFNAGYTWSGTATENGTVSIDSNGLATITGVAAGTSSTATITNTTASYTGASATVSATSITGSALNPTFGTPTATADGFTVQITNYSASYDWADPTVTAGSVSAGTPSGTNRLLTVTGLTAGQSATITQTTSRTGYSNGTATVSRTALSNQTITWTPTTALQSTGSPVTFSSATALDSAVITYAVQSAGTTGCSVVSGTRALTFTSPGSCTVRASAAATSNYLAGTADVTFVISQTTYSITVTQGTNGTISPGTTSVNHDANQTFTFAPASGYSVASITVDGTALSGTALTNAIASGYTFSNVTATHTLTATYSANSYTVTYKAGANGAGSDLTQDFVYGNTATIKNGTAAFTRSGYGFVGWSTTDGGAQTHAFDANYSTASNLILYPVWLTLCTVTTSRASTTTKQSITATGNCAWIVPSGVTSLTVLVVGGGGGGGWQGNGGAGGGGGVLYTTTHSVTAGQSFLVSVGAGGTTTYSAAGAGGNGSDSKFGAAVAAGGGGGAGGTSGTSVVNGKDGGSGGGGSSNNDVTTLGGAKTVVAPSSNGWSAYGGNGAGGFNGYGGGGGGASANASGKDGGAGITLLGVTVGAGGTSGGIGTAGAVNTGKGGGAASAGGSGLVAIQFAETNNDATLSSLAISVGTLSPDFASGTTTYTASVTNSTASVTVTPTVTQSGASVQVKIGSDSFASVASGNASGTLTLSVGANVITVRVTARDGSTTSEYTVTVTKAGSSISTLSGLSLSNSVSISPTFASATTAYTASVGTTTRSLTVTPSRTQPNATIEAKIGSGSYSSVTSGSASGSLALNVGDNIISVRVTAQDGSTTTTYTITVTLPASTDAALSALAPSSGTLTNTFSSGTISYTARVANAIATGFTLTPTVRQIGATFVQYVGASGTTPFTGALNVGENIIRTIVTAENGTSTQPYTVTVTREPVVPTITKFDVQVRSNNTTLVPNKTKTSLLNANYSPTFANSQTVEFTVNATTTDLGALTWRVRKGTDCAASSVINPGSSAITLNTTNIVSVSSSYTCYIVEVVSTLNSVTAIATSTYQFLPQFTTSPVTTNATAAANNLSGVVGATYSNSTPFSVSGGGGSWQYYILNAPAGLTIDSSTGIISGTFTTIGSANGSIGAIDANGGSVSVSSISWTVSSGSALTPSFGTVTSTADGFTVQITNYSASYTWATPTVTVGSVSAGTPSGSNRLLTVTGLTPGQTATITQGTSRTGYSNGSATVDGTATTGSALNPTFGTPTATADGFTVQVTNYSASYTWATPTVTAGSVSAGTPSGSNRLLTVTGLTPGQTATITQGTSRTGYSNGTATVDGTATTGSALNPTFGTPTATADGFTVQITNYDANYTWATPTVTAGSVSAGTPSGSNRLLTVTGLTPGQTATITQGTSRTGYSNGTATVDGTATTGAAFNPTFGTPTATADGFTVQITNYSASYTWAGTATASGSVAISGTGLVTVTGVAPGTLSTATITTTRTGYSNGSATVDGTSLSNVATLSALTLSAGTLSPTFDSATTTYAVSVANSVATGFTLTPTVTQANATSVQYLGSTGTTSFAGALSVGANVIRIVVTAQDGSTTSTYTVTVTRALETYTITLAAGTGGSGSNQTLTKTNGTSLTLPDSATANSYFTRAGYTVTGWSASSGGTQAYALSGSYTTESATTLYPVWTGKTLTVTFDSDGGSAVSNGSVVVGVTLSAPTAPTKTGLNFVGWSRTSGGALVTFPYTHAATSDFTLYAIWTAVYTTGLRFYVDATDTSSLASNSALAWRSIAPATSRASGDPQNATVALSPSPGRVTFGPSKRVNYGRVSEVSIAGDITVESWIKLPDNYTQTVTNQVIATHYYDVSGNKTNDAMDWYWMISNGRFYLYMGNGLGTEINRASALVVTTANAGKWVHVAFVQKQNGDITFYFNGKQAGTATGYARRAVTNTQLNLGINSSSSMNASMSKFRIYAGALTIAQIQGNMNADASDFSRLQARTLTIDSGSYSSSTSTPPTITATASAGTGTKTFTSSTTAVCTVNSSTGVVAFVTGGTCTISASIAADSTYDAATSASISFTAVALTVTYDSKGGSSVSNGSTVSGGAISAAPTAPTLANYTFAGWSDTDGGTVVTFPFTHGKTASFTMYAKWTANAYKLTYVYNSADGGTRPVDADFTTGGTAIVLPTPTRTGYTFDGWFSNAGLTSSIGAAGGNYSPSGTSLTPSAYARWVAINYTVTYATTNYTGGAAPTDSGNYNIGNNVIIKANTGSLARTGYSLDGWTAASDGTGTVLTSGSTFTTSSSNMTFYPKWSANTYTITFNKNGGSGAPGNASTTYTTGGTAVDLSTAPGSLSGLTKTGFDLTGWSTSPTGSVISTGYTTAADVTLYAIWTLKTINVTYDKGAASSATIASWPANTSGSFNTSITLGTPTSQVAIPGAGNYEFSSWLLVGTLLTFEAGSTYTLPATNPTLRAQWVQVFEVRYTMNGGTSATGFTYDEQCNAITHLCTAIQIQADAAPTRSGYTFTGWRLQNGDPVAAGGTFTVGIETYLLYAQWAPIDYTITYFPAGGAITPTESVKQIGQSFNLAAAPTRTGYNFAGWSDTASIFGAGVTYYVGASAVNLTAQWTPKVYTVVYDWNGGSGSSTADDSYTVGNSGITLPVQGDHVKDGYTFGGWSLTDSGSLISGAFTPTANTTLYAIWNVGTYTLTYNANGGTVSTPSATIANGSSLTLPTPTRANFVFEGWYSASTGGVSIGAAGANFQPAQSRTIYARWTQSSLYGLSPTVLTRIGTLAASDGSDSTFTNSNSNSSVTVVVPDGALPAGTNIYFDRVGDFSRAQSAIAGTNSYIISLVVSWLALDGTVPNTNTGKSIAVTIANASIKAGASVYGIVAGNVTLLGTATQDGTVTVQLTSDPEVVVVATKPGAPTNLAVTTVNDQADLTWSAPSSDGGSAITGYTVTGTGGVSCTTINTSCAITGLTTGTAYTFTVTATNALGTSAVSTSAGATTASRPDSPTSVAATSNATRQSVISWTAPVSNGGSAITGYTVTANSGGTCTTVTTTCTITGLSDATTYTFTVIATNVIGSSDSSSSASATTASAVVNNGGGGSSGGSGGSSSTPAPVEPVAPSTPVKSNVTVAPSVTVVGGTEVKIPTVEVTVPTAESQIKPPVLTLDAASKKFIAEVKVVEGKIVLTAETGFSGKRTVTVTITENGEERFVQIPLIVLPEPVAKPVLTPTAATKSIIRWSASDNADSYTVLLNSKRVCSTSTTTCSVSKLLGPDARVEVISNGGDRTLSERIKAEFKQINPVTITRVVSATITKSSLTAVDTKALDKVVALVKTQGFGSVVISQITTTKKTQALADARIVAIKKYINSKAGSEKITFEVVPPSTRTYFNNIAVKG